MEWFFDEPSHKIPRMMIVAGMKTSQVYVIHHTEQICAVFHKLFYKVELVLNGIICGWTISQGFRDDECRRDEDHANLCHPPHRTNLCWVPQIVFLNEITFIKVLNGIFVDKPSHKVSGMMNVAGMKTTRLSVIHHTKQMIRFLCIFLTLELHVFEYFSFNSSLLSSLINAESWIRNFNIKVIRIHIHGGWEDLWWELSLQEDMDS